LAWYGTALVAIGGLSDKSLQQSLPQKLHLLLDELFGLAKVVLDEFELLAVQGLQLVNDFGINSCALHNRLLLKKTIFSYYGE